MKAINLQSIISAKNSLKPEVFESYISSFKMEKPKEKEMQDLKKLVDNLKERSKKLIILDKFYIGYKISQISKEFDLLRFGNNSIINIELKNINTGEKIKKQLIKNEYYLSFLRKQIYNFTYVAQDNHVYFLDETENLIEVDFEFLIKKLLEQQVVEFDDVDKQFDPSNYLVSPFNSTDSFINDQYFLTNQQEKIKNEILELEVQKGPCFISIEGAAGTGKTLLTYDIAKEYINNSKRVIIAHCGILNNGHKKLIDSYSWGIIPVKCFNYCHLKEYDLIVIDEFQRMYKSQLKEFLENIVNANIKCIFSYDSKQCLASREIRCNIPEFINKEVSPKHFKLTEKIRSNKEIASFIKNLFDVSKENKMISYTNIDVKYFSNSKEAKKYIALLTPENWKLINYTSSEYTHYPYDDHNLPGYDNAHQVIGQEYDKVIAIIDEYFYYKDGKYLSTKGFSSSPYYHPTKMLFQILTRTRKKLCIIIINNEPVLNQCLKILESSNK